MRFLTWSNNPNDPRCELLFKSAKHFGIEVEPIGVGKEYRGGVSKIEWLCDWLDDQGERNHELCCVCDAFDSLFLQSVDEIEFETQHDNIPEEQELYSAYENDAVVFAGERWFRGRPPRYRDQFVDGGVYRYPNAGLVAGCGWELKREYNRMRDWSEGSLETREQWFVTIRTVNSNDIVVDHNCRLFYCCGGEWRRFAGEVVDGRFRNKRTGTFPYILHAPIPRRSLPIREKVARELGII